MRLGAHLSIAKGLPKAVEMAEQIGANTFAFFTRNPRGGAKREIGEAEIEAWNEARKQADLFPIVGHFPYTVNLGSPKDDTWNFGRQVVREDLERANRFGAEFLVLHPGRFDPKVGEEAGIQRIIDALAWALDGLEVKTVILLEGMAGQGNELGRSPEQLGKIIQGLGAPENIGVCLDSCHQFAAGWDLTSHDGIDKMLEAYDKHVGLDRIRALHLNDSKTPCGSHRDRHELIGKGTLGLEGIKSVVTHPFFQKLPMILETPINDYKEYAEEIQAVRRLLDD